MTLMFGILPFLPNFLTFTSILWMLTLSLLFSGEYDAEGAN